MHARGIDSERREHLLPARCTGRPSYRWAGKTARQLRTRRHDAADIPSSTIAPAVRVAVVHDWLDTWRGGERCWRRSCASIPMPICSRWSTFCRTLTRGALVASARRTSFLQRVPFARAVSACCCRSFPRAIESLDLSAYDLVISSSHAVAKGVRTRPGQLHICYCYTPMRYAWDLRDQYSRRRARPRAARLRREADCCRACARGIARRAHASIISSPSRTTSPSASSVATAATRRSSTRPSTVDTLSSRRRRAALLRHRVALVPYKRIDLHRRSVPAAAERELVVIGEGPERARIARDRSAQRAHAGQARRRERDRWLAGRAHSSSPRRRTSASRRSKRRRAARR